MSKEQIKKVAIKHFNQFGFDGTKMAQIAEEAGIRKQSLSYHYPTKKVLLMEVYKEVIEEECAFVRHYFEEHKEEPLEKQLYDFITEHKNRFLTEPNVTLMYSLSFITPLEVHDFVLSQFRMYLTALKEVLRLCFTQHKSRLSPEECTIAFVTMLDGLDIQLVYETRLAYERAQKITWDIYWRGIQ
ncbi:TetR/AcrR family transcriptional regulator [Neobacillus drentensis]|uniref:TetR/AcrR family transcriptional regulator n=1 Tax=Neobacillus drentensis TaxID=220684 RepID=UPI001F2DFAF2|nr:TetR/AcrR family transcriptional regulator [Neobacillus drentensis]ULT57891.1 TetR/AcrR family transcriptional regulator [Neobacillus drentensis]